MRNVLILVVIMILSLTAFNSPVNALQESTAADTAVVTRRHLSPEFSAVGTLTAHEAMEYKLEFKAYKGSAEIASVAMDGRSVNKGDTILTVTLEDMDDALASAHRELDEARQGQRQTERDLSQHRELQDRQLESRTRKLEEAAEEFNYFKNESGPRSIEASQNQLARTEYRMENEREELEQLEKMYAESDLAVDTQEIVLRRARRSIQLAEVNAKHVRANHERFIQVDYPRRLRNMEDGVRNQDRDLRHFQQNAEGNTFRKRMALEKAQRRLQDAKQAQADLEADAQLTEITSITDGIFVSGSLHDRVKSERGGGLADSFAGLKIDDAVKSGQVLFSVFDASQYFVAFSIPEGQIANCRAGMKAECTVGGLPSKPFDGEVTDVAFLPSEGAGGKVFWASASLSGSHAVLRPDMSVQISVALPTVENALSLPAAYVKQKKNGKHECTLESGEKRDVIVGARDGDFLQILKGLNEGDVVVKN